MEVGLRGHDDRWSITIAGTESFVSSPQELRSLCGQLASRVLAVVHLQPNYLGFDSALPPHLEACEVLLDAGFRVVAVTVANSRGTRILAVYHHASRE